MNVWVDPVCAMRVTGENPPAVRVGRVEYRFCSEMCRDAFAERPGRYLKSGDLITGPVVVVEPEARRD